MASLPPNYQATIVIADFLESGETVNLNATVSQVVQVVSSGLLIPGNPPLATFTQGGSIPPLNSPSGSGEQTHVWLRGDDSWATLPQVAYTSAPFTVPAIGSTVPVSIFAASWPAVGGDVYYSDGTHRGFMDIFSVGGPTSVTLKNTGTATAGNVVASDAIIRLQGPPSATSTASGLVPTPPNTTSQWFRGDASFQTIPNVTISAPGLVPTAPNDATKVLRGDAAFGTLAYTSLSSLPTLGTAAAQNIPATGNASTGQVVYGTDSRLSDSRNPLAHAATTHIFTGSDPVTTGGVSYYYDCDDFIGPPKFMVVGNSAGAGAVSANITTRITGRSGIMQLAPGTTATQYARAYAYPIFLGDVTTIVWRGSFYSGATSSSVSQHIFGLTDSPNGIIATTGNYIVFYYQPSTNGFWNVQTRVLTAVTNTTGSATALNTWNDLIIVASTSSVSFYVNGSLMITSTTNIPAAGTLLYPCFFAANGANTANYSLYGDCVEISVATGITAKFSKGMI